MRPPRRFTCRALPHPPLSRIVELGVALSGSTDHRYLMQRTRAILVRSQKVPVEGHRKLRCANCNSAELIKAHLIPRAFAVEVLVGKSLVANVRSSDSFKSTQSGIWDKEILCGKCDGILGAYEDYALRVTQRIRAQNGTAPWQQRTLSDIETDKILRFCAGILYKYSLTKPENGRIRLGRYQEVLRQYIFNPSEPCPSELDALFIRPLRFAGDDGVFAYRAPRDDRQDGLNCYRMMMGGVIFFVYLDARSARPFWASPHLIKKHSDNATVTIVDAQAYEEFTIPERLANSGRLSDHLDHLEAQSRSK